MPITDDRERLPERVTLADAGPIVHALVAVIVAHAASLSELDGAIGDGDHGVNMSKGFRLAAERIGDTTPDLARGLALLGDTLQNEIGGSMGPIYGTFFGEMADGFASAGVIDRASFARSLAAATDAVSELGGAKPGDKTLLDVLTPAVRAFEAAAARDESFASCLAAMTRAADDGFAATRDLVARVGRAARLGERSRGVHDPGAASCRLLLNALAEGLLQRLASG
jgi:phosphoenolpyruvate---glycerone phosphotransferase subunit DhaL